MTREIQTRDLDIAGFRAYNPAAPTRDNELARVQDIAPTVAAPSDLTAYNTTNLTSCLRWCAAFRDGFRFDSTSSATVDGITVVAAFGGVGRWIRLLYADPSWAEERHWYFDSAGTNPTIGGAPGNDAADGLSALTPLRSVAEWRRRIRGAQWGGGARIALHPLSSSTNLDDGHFHGFTTEKNGATQVVILGPTTVIRTSTITGYVPYASNVRGKTTDSTIPTSWTASGLVTVPAASRWIRKQGSGSQPHASLDVDLGSKTVQMSAVTAWDDSTVAASSQFLETNFTNGDTYEVYTLLGWPNLVSQENVVYKNLDVFGANTVQTNSGAKQNNFILCGFVGAGTGATVVSLTGGNELFYACVFCGGPVLWGAGSGPVFCTFLNILVQQVASTSSWKGLTNVFIGTRFYLESGGRLGSTGLLRMYDVGGAGAVSSQALIQASTGSAAWIESMVGEGNTLPLVVVDRNAQIAGAANITATTSASPPYLVNGVAYSSPVADDSTGDAVYG